MYYSSFLQKYKPDASNKSLLSSFVYKKPSYHNNEILLYLIIFEA